MKVSEVTLTENEIREQMKIASETYEETLTIINILSRVGESIPEYSEVTII